MQTVPAIADRIPELIGLLAEQGVEPAGAPFLRYAVLGPGDELVVEAGVPVDYAGVEDGPVYYSVLPGGRFAMLTHRGHFEGLMDATTDLVEWGHEHDVRWDVTYTDEAELWGGAARGLQHQPARGAGPGQLGDRPHLPPRRLAPPALVWPSTPGLAVDSGVLGLIRGLILRTRRPKLGLRPAGDWGRVDEQAAQDEAAPPRGRPAPGPPGPAWAGSGSARSRARRSWPG